MLLSKCDEITGGRVDTTDGGATGDVRTRGLVGRNLFGDKTCCGALATCERESDKKNRRQIAHKSSKRGKISFPGLTLTVICGAGLRLATVDEMVNLFYNPRVENRCPLVRFSSQISPGEACRFCKKSRREDAKCH